MDETEQIARILCSLKKSKPKCIFCKKISCDKKIEELYDIFYDALLFLHKHPSENSKLYFSLTKQNIDKFVQLHPNNKKARIYYDNISYLFSTYI